MIELIYNLAPFNVSEFQTTATIKSVVIESTCCGFPFSDLIVRFAFSQLSSAVAVVWSVTKHKF